MARKGGIPINGWLALDKPLGISSAQAVARVMKITNAKKAGHGGTLDPLASGILPIALGEATKTVSYVMDGIKTYRWTVRWGEETATGDAEGVVTATHPHRPSRDAILAALPAFMGEIEQIPPVYSALKIDGERAYDLARRGIEVDMAPRRVVIRSLALIDLPDGDHAVFEAVVGKGTYIRSLGCDIAKALGTLGHLIQLRRTSCGPFHEGNAISLETLADLGHGPALPGFLLPVETALDDIPALALTESETRRLRTGQPLELSSLTDRAGPDPRDFTEILRAMDGKRLVALVRAEGTLLRSVRVFNSDPEP